MPSSVQLQQHLQQLQQRLCQLMMDPLSRVLAEATQEKVRAVRLARRLLIVNSSVLDIGHLIRAVKRGRAVHCQLGQIFCNMRIADFWKGFIPRSGSRLGAGGSAMGVDCALDRRVRGRSYPRSLGGHWRKFCLPIWGRTFKWCLHFLPSTTTRSKSSSRPCSRRQSTYSQMRSI